MKVIKSIIKTLLFLGLVGAVMIIGGIGLLL